MQMRTPKLPPHIIPFLALAVIAFSSSAFAVVFVPQGYAHVGHVNDMVRGRFLGASASAAHDIQQPLGSAGQVESVLNFESWPGPRPVIVLHEDALDDVHDGDVTARGPIEHKTILFTKDGVVYEKSLPPTPSSHSSTPSSHATPKQARRLLPDTNATSSSSSSETATTSTSNLTSTTTNTTPNTTTTKASTNPSPETQSETKHKHDVHGAVAALLDDDVGMSPDLNCEGCPDVDIRVQVQDATAFPYASVGMLTKLQRGPLSGTLAQCTATLITPRHLITAAHCVVSPEAWQPVTSMEWWPGANGLDEDDVMTINTNDDDGRSRSVAHVRVLKRYLDLGSETVTALNYDFALVTLEEPVPIPRFKPLNISAGITTATYDLRTAGYPGDKPEGTMWTVDCHQVYFDYVGSLFACQECENIVIHTCLSKEGQSGSAMWQVNPPTPTSTQVRSILTGVIYLNDGTAYNVATEMNAFVYNTLAGWVNEDEGNKTVLREVPARGADKDPETVSQPGQETPGRNIHAPEAIFGVVEIPFTHIEVPVSTILLVLLIMLVVGSLALLLLNLLFPSNHHQSAPVARYSNFSY